MQHKLDQLALNLESCSAFSIESWEFNIDLFEVKPTGSLSPECFLFSAGSAT